MPFEEILVTEIFHSIQGETSLAGIPFVFVRLTGCNLRCSYCDSAYAFKNGTRLRICEIEEQVSQFNCKNVLITGGEPLMQRNTLALVQTLSKNFSVSIETHGEFSIAPYSPYARIVMDIKTPSSQMCRKNYVKNLPFLTPEDEIKFVIASQEDYAWSKSVLENELKTINCKILFSAAMPAKNQPGFFPGVSLQWLAEKILQDQLTVRLQLQLHKFIWGMDVSGV